MSKVGKEIEKGAKNWYNSGKKTLNNTYHAVGDVFDVTGQFLQGDIKGFGREISDFSKHTAGALTGYAETVSGVGIVSGGKLSDVAGNVAGAITSYGTGQIARGSDYVEAATGSDVFGRQEKRDAEAAAAAAKAEAAADATAERRAQLLGLKKQLVPVLRGSLYRGAADAENLSGIVLG